MSAYAAAHTAQAGARVLAALDESKVTPGVTGFLVVALLGIALWFLLRSFVRHLGRVRFDEDAVEQREVGRAGAASADGRRAREGRRTQDGRHP
ncbi:hypothetical protein EV189_2738 [Motilibacter rhizosphaerae]|uniref:Uncharacterized protein n=1 Tax=Motilibacter rhizosphaerae TaxID=598652 RepID=A0A4Q7NQ34_9ACTN|nr:hypothetical protein [Motilibacter rhizosphaerae]RZS87313.1 hypothetical protein EV189_2738 [Motilibacter rhizosphaerae]